MLFTFLFIAIIISVSNAERPHCQGTGASCRLENGPQCGTSTEGQAECYFDCLITSSAQGSGQLIQNLTCLQDCFSSDENEKDFCITSLLNDVISKGVCNLTDEFGYNPGPGIYPEVECVMGFVSSSYGFDLSVVDNGTCSPGTEELLLKKKCRTQIMEQQGFIQNTLLQLIQSSCDHNVSEFYVNFMLENLPGGRKKRNAEETQLHSRVKRLAPAQVIYGSDNIRTKLNFKNTKNRYSWVCSLRSITGHRREPEHLFAVNLLSIPPKPTVVVGAAHCTYLCKNDKRMKVSSCCCSSRPNSCADNQTMCGDHPRVRKMLKIDAKIVCGEWNTLTNDENQFSLRIKKIIRHPDFDATAGPIGGNDIAVFKVIEMGLNAFDKTKPVCLPSKTEEPPSTGIHTGWSKPPPISYINKHAKEYAEFYDDFFKQWHYKMDILEKCEDPRESPITGETLKYPSNSSYPAGTVCAKDFSKQSCFSTGESGSPLMVQEGDKSSFSIHGILSYVKGCDVFSFGTTNTAKKNAQLIQQTENPSTYTKLSCFLPWIAAQYNMKYLANTNIDPACSVGSGNPEDGEEPCRIIPSNLIEVFTGEVECKFPFYYKNKKYDGCILFEEDGFIYPVFRCPTRDITTKINRTNSFEFLSLVDGYCPADATDPASPLDPSITDCSPFARRAPFSQCKNNCPGVQAFGIMGGGASLKRKDGKNEK